MNKRHLEKTVRWILYVMLMVTVLTAFIALVDKRTGSETPAADAPVSEAPVGSFESTAFNEGWVMTEGGKDRTITLPSDRPKTLILRRFRTILSSFFSHLT